MEMIFKAFAAIAILCAFYFMFCRPPAQEEKPTPKVSPAPDSKPVTVTKPPPKKKPKPTPRVSPAPDSKPVTVTKPPPKKKPKPAPEPKPEPIPSYEGGVQGDFMSFNIHAGTKSELVDKKFYLYAHVFSDGAMYIGYSSDPVTRWEKHLYNALERGSGEFNFPFKVEIRKELPKHLILAAHNTQANIEDLEAAAIEHYKPSLNTNRPNRLLSWSYKWPPIGNFVGDTITLKRKTRKSGHDRNLDGYGTVKAQVVYEHNRLRLIVISPNPLHNGKRIRMARGVRVDKLKTGDVVTLLACYSEKSNCFVTKSDLQLKIVSS